MNNASINNVHRSVPQWGGGVMDRNKARQKWRESGIEMPLTVGEIQKLRDRIDAKLEEADSYFRCVSKIRVGATDSGLWFALYCKANYFDRRECVTFYRNDEGLPIGFAGWADDESIAPVLAAFCEWVDWLASVRSKARAEPVEQ